MNTCKICAAACMAALVLASTLSCAEARPLDPVPGPKAEKVAPAPAPAARHMKAADGRVIVVKAKPAKAPRQHKPAPRKDPRRLPPR